jgi:CBS domain containing-hemolysin-like protein
MKQGLILTAIALIVLAGFVFGSDFSSMSYLADPKPGG